MRSGQPEARQHPQDARRLFRSEQPDPPRIHGIERQPDAHRLAVRQLECGHALEPVCRPVAVIERTRFVRLEGITAIHDVARVELCRAHDDRPCNIHGTSTDRRTIALERLEERGILEQCDLDGLAEATAPDCIRQRGEEGPVAHDGVRWCERAGEVLLSAPVHPILHAHGAVILRQDRGGHADMPHATMGDRSTEAHGIEHGASADRQQHAVPVDLDIVDGIEDILDAGGIVLARLAALHRLDPHEFRQAIVCKQIAIEPFGQIWPGSQHT